MTRENRAGGIGGGRKREDVRLTEQQMQVATLVAQDLTSREIAERLGLSRKTVEFHRHEIRKKLGVAGTAGITCYAIRAGLIRP